MAERLTDGGDGTLWLGLALGLGAGFGCGYYVAKKRLELKYDKIAQTEIDEAREYYVAARKAVEQKLKEPINEVVEYLGYVKPEENGQVDDEEAESEAGQEGEAEDAEEGVEISEEGTGPGGEAAGANPRIDYTAPGRDEQAGQSSQGRDAGDSGSEDEADDSDDGDNSAGDVNVFEGVQSHYVWDYAVETKARGDKSQPYVIHVDELGEFDHDHVTYQWYYDDRILTDEDDTVIENIHELVGSPNLLRFGHGTGNNNVVIIRNDRLNLEMEILRVDGRYADTQGFLQHNNYDVERILRRHTNYDDEPR